VYYLLSFFSVTFLPFPSLYSSISSCTLSKTMDGILTALRTRWRRMLPSLWINVVRGISLYFTARLYCKGGENSRIFEYKICTSPRLPVSIFYIYWPAEHRLENNRSIWVELLLTQSSGRVISGKYDNLSISFVNWQFLSYHSSTFYELFSRDSLPLNYGVVNNSHVLLINLYGTLILAFVQLFIVI
jgi:hypothetical protein